MDSMEKMENSGISKMPRMARRIDVDGKIQTEYGRSGNLGYAQSIRRDLASFDGMDIRLNIDAICLNAATKWTPATLEAWINENLKTLFDNACEKELFGMVNIKAALRPCQD